MKKLLNLLALTTLSTSAMPTVSMVLNTSVVKNLSLKDRLKSDTDNPFISQMSGTSGAVKNLITDNNGTVYAGGVDGTVYKCLAGQTSFTAMTGTSGQIESLTTDNQGNVYAGSGTVYKCLAGQTNFVQMSGTLGTIYGLSIDTSNNVYAKSGSNNVYKCLAGQTNFKAMTGTSGQINLLSTDTSNNVYAGSSNSLTNGTVYKCLAGQTSFTAMTGTSGQIESLTTDNQGNVYAGSGTVYKCLAGQTSFTAMTGTSGTIYLLSTDTSGTVYALNNNGSVYKCLAGQTSFTAMTGIIGEIEFLTVDNQGNIYAFSTDGLFKCLAGQTSFTEITGISGLILNLTNDNDGNFYYNDNQNVYKIHLLDNLITSKQPDYYGPKYNGFVYNKQQTLDLKEQYLKSAILDDKSLTIPSTNVPITVGQHKLVLTVKDEVKQYLDLFGGNPTTGEITYHFWVKTAIDSTTEFNYSTKKDDTDLLTGLVSNAGNTKDCAIINTKAKGSAAHPATLTTTIASNMIDLNNSYYVAGTVDSKTNNFTENSSTKKPVPKNLSITTDGIYHLHLVDVVGNTYDSYLELGFANWKLTGDFDDQKLKHLEAQLNVSVNVVDPNDQQLAMGWLQNYQRDVANAVSKTVSDIGKGFDIEIKPEQYKEFLDHVDYTTTSHHEAINQDKLNQMIINLANQMLKDGLNKLPKDLNVDTSNVVNRQTLYSYTSWITGYQNFINKNKDIWFNQVTDVASRGFASATQIQQIKDYLNGLDFSNYLQHITWKPNTMLTKSNDYKQFVQLNKLQSDTIAWVNQNIPAVNQAYQNAINQAESGLNMHGYKLSDLLGDNQLPQTKSQIDNYKDGLSFRDWLQQQADGYYHTWQLKMGLAIGLPLLALASFAGLVLYWKFSYKHNPIRAADNKHNPIKKAKRKLKSKKSEE